MSEEKLEEILEQETPKDPPVDDSVPKPEEEETVTLTKAEHESLLKAKEVGETYKKENEKYRRVKDRTADFQPKSPAEPVNALTEDQVIVVQNDYLSKREDVYDEFSGEFQQLEEDEWGKIKPLVIPSLDRIYTDSVQSGHYVPIGKLRRAVTDLIAYAKGDKTHKAEIEQAKKETAIEMQKYEQAEISGAKPTKKPIKGVQVTDEDRKRAEDSGGVWTPERAAEIRLKREERETQFKPNDDSMSRW